MVWDPGDAAAEVNESYTTMLTLIHASTKFAVKHTQQTIKMWQGYMKT